MPKKRNHELDSLFDDLTPVQGYDFDEEDLEEVEWCDPYAPNGCDCSDCVAFGEEDPTGEWDLFAENDEDFETAEQDCPRCAGKGRLTVDDELDSDECPHCQGTGYVVLL